MNPPSPSIGLESLLEHGPFLRRLARGLVRDEALAEDLVQETWTRALRRPPAGVDSVRSWLAGVLRRVAIDLHRRGSRVRASGGPRPEREALGTDSELVEHAELARAVYDAVQALAEPYRSTILLRYYEDLPPRAIARRQQVPLATVRTRLARGKTLLREQLDARLGSRRDWLGGLCALAGRGERALAGASVFPIGVAWLAGAALVSLGLLGLALSAWSRRDMPDSSESVSAARPSAALEGSAPALPGSGAGGMPRREATERRASVAGPPPDVNPAPPNSQTPPTARIEGRVRWTSPAAAGARAQVYAYAVEGERYGRFPLAQQVVEQGAPFALELATGGEVLFLATTEFGVPVARTLTVPAGGRGRVDHVETSEGARIDARLVDEHGAGLAGTRLDAERIGDWPADSHELRYASSRLVDGAPVRTAVRSIESDAGGMIRVAGLHAGTYRLGFPARGSGAADAPLYLARKKHKVDVEIPLETAEIVWHEARVTVRATLDGLPVEGVVATMRAWDELRELAPDARPWVNTLGSGHLSERGELWIAFDPRDDPGILLERPGLEPFTARLREAGDVLHARLRRTELPCTLKLRVTYADPRAPERLEVRLRGADGAGNVHGAWRGELRRTLPVVDGYATLDDAPAGEVRLDVTAPGDTPFLPLVRLVDVRAGTTEVELALQTGAALEVVLDRDLEPDESVNLLLRGEDARHRSVSRSVSERLEAGRPLRLNPPVPPGVYTLSHRWAETQMDRDELRLVAGETTRVSMALPARD